MTVNAAEQLLLEIINRARLDPAAEAARQGIALDQGLAPGAIDATPKQPLAFNMLLDAAAEKHSLWMIANNTFSHTGVNGSSPSQRMEAEGYDFGSFGGSAENLAYIASTGQINGDDLIDNLHDNLYESIHHRPAIFRDLYREVGLGQEQGLFTTPDSTGVMRTFNITMLTENFARAGDTVFLTGVVYDDRDGDVFYDIGEGIGGHAVSGGGQDLQTLATGGYSLSLATPGQMAVSFGAGAQAIGLAVDLSQRNAKVDLVNGTEVLTSGSLTVTGGGVTAIRAIGLFDVNLTGGAGAELLMGNSAANLLNGGAGDDTIEGDTGDDELHGVAGNDLIYAGLGNDLVFGGTNFDTIHAGDGSDTVYGGDGRDLVFLNQGNDLFNDNAQGGELGRDTVFAGYGDDTVQGGNGDDVFHGEWGNDLIYGRLGNDLIFGGDNFDTIHAGEGNDTVYGGNGRDLIFLNQGDDLYNDNAQGGELGRDTVFGGFGNDTIEGGNGDDSFFGEWGNDVIRARLGNDVLGGGDGNDTLDGGAGNDTLTGGTGSDDFIFTGEAGADVVTDFNIALDRVLFAGAASALTLTDTAAGVSLSWGAGSALLEGVSAAQFDLSDVILI